MERRAYERAWGLNLESRAEVVKRMKKGKVAYQKRQRIIRKINKALKKAN